MGEKHLEAVDVIDEELLHRPGALVLNDAEGQILKLFLQRCAQAQQRAIGCIVGNIQAPAVEQRLRHQAEEHARCATCHQFCRHSAPAHERLDDLIGQHEWQHAAEHAQKHNARRRIEAALMRPRIEEYFFKHDGHLPVKNIFLRSLPKASA